MKFPKFSGAKEQSEHFTPEAVERFPIEAAEAFQPEDELYRENGVWPGLTGYFERYVNLTHLVWSMCAMLADSNIDPDWTGTFGMWRTEWRQFNKSFEIHGNTTRTLDVPPSPVNVIWIQKPNSLKFVQIGLSEYKEKYDNRSILQALWNWMLYDVPPEAIVEGTYIIKLGYESWFRKD
ncbi:hypothetical protein N7463_010043 [Penicillium fimorum]|uniref:Uncharacterized protein n=1 Tax=Penicillium fimorum TaxID=1882269 RepID=A0A9W9XJ52_9EURO|nr:hypothetical protein N7463_010043 [Penicillium fimorum]